MPRAPKPTAIPMFPEPDHAPEHAAITRYENLRDNNPFLGLPDDPREDQRSDLTAGCRPGCVVPSHQEWFRDQYPGYPPAGECAF